MRLPFTGQDPGPDDAENYRSIARGENWKALSEEGLAPRWYHKRHPTDQRGRFHPVPTKVKWEEEKEKP